MEFIDTHAHLTMIEHSLVEDVMRRAEKADVKRIITISTEQNNFRRNQELAIKYPNVYYTLGVHPHEAVNWIQWAQDLSQLLSDRTKAEKCVGVGEIGLDFHYRFSPPEIQIDAFENQLAFAQKHDLPVIIHCREAFEELFASIEKIGLPERGGVMHCFTGSPLEAKRSVELGLKISFSGIFTFPNADPIREAAKTLSPSDILIETDAPYLAPIPYRGQPNEPSYLPKTAIRLAEVLELELEKVAQITTHNAIEFFQLR